VNGKIAPDRFSKTGNSSGIDPKVSAMQKESGLREWLVAQKGVREKCEAFKRKERALTSQPQAAEISAKSASDEIDFLLNIQVFLLGTGFGRLTQSATVASTNS
jgi:hypothetical protein